MPATVSVSISGLGDSEDCTLCDHANINTTHTLTEGGTCSYSKVVEGTVPGYDISLTIGTAGETVECTAGYKYLLVTLRKHADGVGSGCNEASTTTWKYCQSALIDCWGSNYNLDFYEDMYPDGCDGSGSSCSVTFPSS